MALTVVDEDVEQHGDGVGDEILVLELAHDGGEMVAVDYTSTVLICVCARVANNAQSMDFDAMAHALSREHLEEEVEDARFPIREAPGDCVELVCVPLGIKEPGHESNHIMW